MRKLAAIGLWVVLLVGCAAPGAPRAVDSGAAAAPAGAAFVNARAIIIVRHADIDVQTKATMGNATPLLPAGQERAKGLIAMLKNTGVTRIIDSPALRTQQTAAPVAEALKIKAEDGPAAGDEVVSFLAKTAKPEETILLVHHHSVIPSILAGFGFEKESMAVDATEFDRVYVILPNAEKHTYQLLRLRYGGTW